MPRDDAQFVSDDDDDDGDNEIEKGDRAERHNASRAEENQVDNEKEAEPAAAQGGDSEPAVGAETREEKKAAAEEVVTTDREKQEEDVQVESTEDEAVQQTEQSENKSHVDDENIAEMDTHHLTTEQSVTETQSDTQTLKGQSEEEANKVAPVDSAEPMETETADTKAEMETRTGWILMF